MNLPALLDPNLLPVEIDGDCIWEIEARSIRSIQQTFVQYMKAGLDLHQIHDHIDRSKNYNFENSLAEDCAPFCAAAISMPHPEISSLINYVHDISMSHHYEVHRWLDKLFDRNKLRKYRIFESIDNRTAEHFFRFTTLEDDDVCLCILANDPRQIDRFIDFANQDHIARAVLEILPFDGRNFYSINSKQGIMPHSYAIHALKIQALAIKDNLFKGVDKARPYDKRQFDLMSSSSLDQDLDLNIFRTPERDHGILEDGQALASMRRHPDIVIDTLRHALAEDMSGEFSTTLLEKYVERLLQSGMDGKYLFYRICEGMSVVDYSDHAEHGDQEQDRHLRDMINCTGGFWQEHLKVIARVLVRREPFEEVKQACFSDRLKELACAIMPEHKQSLMAEMSGASRSQILSGDLGL